MTLTNQTILLMNELPENKQQAILTIVQSMVDPDDHLTEEDIADILEARAEFSRGEYIRHEDIDWN
ncbi:MAG: hypothetical protein FWD97_09020 [Defluviitaleaceae bacterium]|nr:hypothetical protein [Defluviitaleaceae bacterium]